jgi:enoyl-CoA hydratase/carnithine racemase
VDGSTTPASAHRSTSGEGVVGLQVVAGVATITLASPPVNALARPVISGLEVALDRVEAGEGGDARVVVVRSAVDGLFAAGADLDLMREADTAGFMAYLDELRHVVERVAELDVPVIAAIDGHALGGGLELALACTLRVATTRARLGVPEIRLGLVPGAGGTQRLPRVVGQAAAAELVLTGRALRAEEALACGLVGRVCAPEDLDEVLTTLTTPIARGSRTAVAGALRCLRAAQAPGAREGALVERGVLEELFGGADAREGVAAFLERREPVFVPGAAKTPSGRSEVPPEGLSTGPE